ncbi:MAG: RNA pseudouridine synthase [Nitrospirae bacterium]|nr:RNA pseudouridine synthase [Nitrospirota bacterium]
MRIKDAMNKGAVWIKSKTAGLQRMRKASTVLKPGAEVELYYDPDLLRLVPPQARCLSDLGHYSVWLKPSGLLSQGTKFGDHCSLLRQAELYFGNKRKVYLVHRLDREASGLMLIGHSKDAAAKLSGLFRDDKISKKYLLEVRGNISGYATEGIIDLPLDGKPAITEFVFEKYDALADASTVSAVIRTGRKHQIRRHFDLAGFPVIGDPVYGTGNKNKTGLKLEAVSLSFICPYQGKSVEFLTPCYSTG